MKRYLIIVENKDLVKIVMENIYNKASDLKLKGKLYISTYENYYKNEDTLIQVISKDENIISPYFDEIIDVTLKSLLKQHTSTLTNSLFDEVLSPTNDNEKVESPKETKIFANKETDVILHKGEIILSNKDVENFLKDAKLVTETLSNLDLSNINLTVNVDGLKDSEKDAQKLATTIMESLKKMGK